MWEQLKSGKAFTHFGKNGLAVQHFAKFADVGLTQKNLLSCLSLLLSTSLSSVPVVSFSQCNLCYVIALSTGMVVLKVYSATKRKIRRIKEM